MRTNFVLTSEKIEGAVTVGFDSNGFLDYVNFRAAKLTPEQHSALMSRISSRIEYVNRLVDGTTGKLVKVQDEITFKAFWSAWLKMWGSNNAGGKIPAERAWNKLKEGDKAAAIEGIRRYSYTIKPGCVNCDGSTYLNQQRWL